ncbi:nucleoside phosphorylase [Plebeiibacterium sediminum]|uniref:Uridine phosphorylase n=1 Tax=Plebeiibacterium sediminum TaxID=2992112 RepID=A0AAE3SDS8_9BACT|nr:nucleoside phosphorylase [Plebeiobacterium sediminum]MCW3785371.1 nucleoside phosphorylase [Plebeiobacterium sediminum]
MKKIIPFDGKIKHAFKEMTKRIEESELIINNDGSVFHLHLKPGELAENIILVGDPDRVKVVASYFDEIELEKRNREFVSTTGKYKGKRFSVVATGIGTDNIDIVMNELDALVNVDFETRQVKDQLTTLNLVRIGTSGSLQKDLPVDSCLLSEKAIGFDGLLNFYANRDTVSDIAFENDFKTAVNWNEKLTSPYVVDASSELLDKLSNNNFNTGVTISAPGFYGPQGRIIRLGLVDSDINEKISNFIYENFRITNYEMECSAIYGLSKLLGHRAATVCAIIANRKAGEYSKDYKPVIKTLIKKVLDSLAE